LTKALGSLSAFALATLVKLTFKLIVRPNDRTARSTPLQILIFIASAGELSVCKVSKYAYSPQLCVSGLSLDIGVLPCGFLNSGANNLTKAPKHCSGALLFERLLLFRFLRNPSRLKPPRPVAKSESAAGGGVAACVRNTPD
jgi:hypothetical protein